MTLVVIMRVHVALGREKEFEDLIAARSRHHRSQRGFERMYLLRPIKGKEYRLVSWWNSIQDPEAWVRTETYALSEDRAHAGLVIGAVPHEVLEIARQF